MMLQALLLASLATVALASICCAPQQWEGFKAVSSFDASGINRYLQGYSYDAINQRYAVSGNYTAAFLGTYKEVWDYGKGTGFRINSLTQTCETFAVTGRFPANCIPSDALELSPATFGFGKERLPSIPYQFNDTRGEFKNIVAYVSAKNCVPITTSTITQRPGGNVLNIECFNEILPGIKDLSVFDPPYYCRKTAKKVASTMNDNVLV
ncbi:ependymin-related protein 1-like [Haliotis rubra]|uniref:ependymin-related protein 1-like n=1 Tax=Haliotis rubra TaxID=36100 RepID=UPI001EE55DA4|nr:ependymin-related protein 1-like [Haliotis rubra]